MFLNLNNFFMRILYLIVFLSLFLPSQSIANEASNWLKKEIDIILDAYKNESMSNETRFLMIEDTINYNFAGTGIAKFVAGDSWKTANKDTKKEYINLQEYPVGIYVIKKGNKTSKFIKK